MDLFINPLISIHGHIRLLLLRLRNPKHLLGGGYLPYFQSWAWCKSRGPWSGPPPGLPLLVTSCPRLQAVPGLQSYCSHRRTPLTRVL